MTQPTAPAHDCARDEWQEPPASEFEGLLILEAARFAHPEDRDVNERFTRRSDDSPSQSSRCGGPLAELGVRARTAPQSVLP